MPSLTRTAHAGWQQSARQIWRFGSLARAFGREVTSSPRQRCTYWQGVSRRMAVGCWLVGRSKRRLRHGLDTERSCDPFW